MFDPPLFVSQLHCAPFLSFLLPSSVCSFVVLPPVFFFLLGGGEREFDWVWNYFVFFKPALTLLDFVIFVFNPFCAMKWGLTLLCGSLFELRRRQKQANSGQLAKSRGLASLPHKPWCYLLFGAKAPVFEPNERKWKRASIPSSVQMTRGFFFLFDI